MREVAELRQLVGSVPPAAARPRQIQAILFTRPGIGVPTVIGDEHVQPPVPVQVAERHVSRVDRIQRVNGIQLTRRHGESAVPVAQENPSRLCAVARRLTVRIVDAQDDQVFIPVAVEIGGCREEGLRRIARVDDVERDVCVV